MKRQIGAGFAKVFRLGREKDRRMDEKANGMGGSGRNSEETGCVPSGSTLDNPALPRDKLL